MIFTVFMVWYHKVEIWNVNYSLAMPLKQLGLSTKVYAARNGGKESRGPWVSLLDILTHFISRHFLRSKASYVVAIL